MNEEIEDIFTQESAKLVGPRSPRRVWTPIVNNNRKRRKRITDALSKEQYEAGWWDRLGPKDGKEWPSGMSPLCFVPWETSNGTSILPPQPPLGLNITPPSEFKHGHPVKYTPAPYEKYPPTPERHPRFSEEEHKALEKLERQAFEDCYWYHHDPSKYPWYLRSLLEMLPEHVPFPTYIEDDNGEVDCHWEGNGHYATVYVYVGDEKVYLDTEGIYHKDGKSPKLSHGYSFADAAVKIGNLILMMRKMGNQPKPFKP